MGKTELFMKQAPNKVQGIPKLRGKEEKKKIIKLCLKKLSTIDDTESLLCKAVLITNTIRSIKQFNDDYGSEYNHGEDLCTYENYEEEYLDSKRKEERSKKKCDDKVTVEEDRK